MSIGIDRNLLHIGAGIAQGMDNSSGYNMDWWPYQLDAPRDWWAIELGIWLYEQSGGGPITLELLNQGIELFQDQLSFPNPN